MTGAMILKKEFRINARLPLLKIHIREFIPTSMAALVSVLVLCVMDVLMGVLFALVSVSMLVLIISMATHLDSPPFLCA